MTWNCDLAGHIYHDSYCTYCDADEVTVTREQRKKVRLTAHDTAVIMSLDGALALAYRLINAVSGAK